MKRSSYTRLLAPALCAALAAGCSLPEWQAATSSTMPRFGLYPSTLLSASDDEDEELPPDETVRLLAPEPVSTPELVTPSPPAPTGSRMRIGIRGGMLSTASAIDPDDEEDASSAEENPWVEATTAGIFLRQSPRTPRKVVIELGADWASIEKEDGSRTSTLYLLHADLLFGSFGPSGGTLYFFLGAHGVMEESTDNATEETASGQGGGAEAGLGLGSKSGSWDLKATYTYLTATENTESNINVTFGFSF